MRERIKNFFTHESLRELATTLNAFCIVEISVVIFFSYMSYELLYWYMGIMTAESLDGVSFWGAIVAIVGAIFSALKYINQTYQKINPKDN